MFGVNTMLLQKGCLGIFFYVKIDDSFYTYFLSKSDADHLPLPSLRK